MKKTVVYLFKCIIAGVISVVVLSLFSMIYHNPPIATVQPDYLTNFRYVPDSGWSYMLEGYGYGRTDSLGYNNAYYDNCNEPDIVFMGSSHMEALQVPQDSNCVYLLNEKFDTDDSSANDFKCLNLGASGHFFEVSASNFSYVAEKFKGAKYIVVEAPYVDFSASMLDDIIECKFHTPDERKGVIHETAQRIPFVRLMYKKLNEASAAKSGTVAGDGDSGADDGFDKEVYIEKMNVVLGRIAELSEANGLVPVILLHGEFSRDADGNIVMRKDDKYKNAFLECCEKTGIRVIDAVPEMINHYNETYELSYGFSNSVPGDGHLNKTGHAIIADEIYKSINEWEAIR